MLITQTIILLLSILALYLGAELVLESAEKIGRHLGFSPLVIGLVIVGFGTSLPEFFVSQLASFRGTPELALGNIIGSNIANLFLILGVAGLMAPLYMLRREILSQLIFHFFLMLLLVFIINRGVIDYIATLILGVFFVAFMMNTFIQMKKQRQLADREEIQHTDFNFKLFALLFTGLLLLYGGGEFLVSSGSQIGDVMGVPPYVISVIFVAFGTSLPEFMTAIIACYRKKNTDLILGNILGSNVFNVSFVLASLGPYKIELKEFYFQELISLIAAAAFLLLLFFLKKNFHRLAGLIFVANYIRMIFVWIG